MFKTILVPVRGDAGDVAGLGTALAVAKLFDGHIDVTHIRSELPLLFPAAGPSSVMISDLKYVSTLRECSEDNRKYARGQYRQFCAGAKIQQIVEPQEKKSLSAAWLEYEGNEIEQIVRMSHRHDLIVLRAAMAGNDGFSLEEAGEIILSRGGPVMLAPFHPPTSIARRIAVAWKNTPEAIRALGAAMPLLYRADDISVISVSDDDHLPDRSLDEIVVRLRWHGLNAVADPIESRQLTPAACLMEHVEALGADLLIMGAYGRNRMREFIFGSFTKRILLGASLPVFLSH